ncbi:hypothetical protein WN944_020241 [Citrus x changshan-huyou]|uniref:Uncharacterized protein n=1 Tax=Citrus x changshan-huyou TaxID=2935761 RepID=A0AAP0LXT0_9ROSI
MIPYHNDNPANVNVKADKNGNFVFVLVKDTSAVVFSLLLKATDLNRSISPSKGTTHLRRQHIELTGSKQGQQKAKASQKSYEAPGIKRFKKLLDKAQSWKVTATRHRLISSQKVLVP